MDVKTFGKVNVLTVNNAITTLKGITLTVRSGAEVRCHVFISSPKPLAHGELL